jgi:predicted acetyltransferase
MNDLKLVFPSLIQKTQVKDYILEFKNNNEKDIPGGAHIQKLDYDEWLLKINNDLTKEELEKGRVPAIQYFGMLDDKIIGTIQIRCELNDYLFNFGGHIGYSIRPSERRKGYADKMLKLALEKCKEMKIFKVLITCDKNNIGSAKTIIKNGGILENEYFNESENEITQRYWISL